MRWFTWPRAWEVAAETQGVRGGGQGEQWIRHIVPVNSWVSASWSRRKRPQSGAGCRCTHHAVLVRLLHPQHAGGVNTCRRKRVWWRALAAFHGEPFRHLRTVHQAHLRCSQRRCEEKKGTYIAVRGEPPGQSGMTNALQKSIQEVHCFICNARNATLHSKRGIPFLLNTASS